MVLSVPDHHHSPRNARKEEDRNRCEHNPLPFRPDPETMFAVTAAMYVSIDQRKDKAFP